MAAAAPSKGHNPTVVHLAWSKYKQQLAKKPLQTKVQLPRCADVAAAVTAARASGSSTALLPACLMIWLLQALTSACVASLSDVIAQRLIGTKYSFTRTIKMAVSTEQLLAGVSQQHLPLHSTAAAGGALPHGTSMHIWCNLEHSNDCMLLCVKVAMVNQPAPLTATP
jgi:hypothetical protein